jgi:hypothetical protein
LSPIDGRARACPIHPVSSDPSPKPLLSKSFSASSARRRLFSPFVAFAWGPCQASRFASAGLDTRRHFAETTATRLSDSIRKRAIDLSDLEKLVAPYSAHDLRHLYAVTEYRKDRDIYRVSKLLGRASIQVTETYLRGLGKVD